MSLAQPLLETAHGVPRRPTRSWWVPWLMPSLNRIGIETPSEARSVFWLALQSFLANSVFVLGRNLGPVIFMHQCGPEALTSVLFLCGAAILVISPIYGRLSKGILVTHVNYWLTLFCAALLAVLAAPLLCANLPAIVPSSTQAPPALLHGIAAYAKLIQRPCAYVMYIAQDILTLLLMMQSASLAQATLNTYSAKRLIGAIQLGCSGGAVFTGLLVGPWAEALGPVPLVYVQVLYLLASLVPNAFIVRMEERFVRAHGGASRKRQTAAKAERRGGGGPGAAPPAPPTAPPRAAASRRRRAASGTERADRSMALWIFR